jgi:hypothetical protein
MGNTLSEDFTNNQEWMERLKTWHISSDDNISSYIRVGLLKPAFLRVDYEIAVKMMELYTSQFPREVLKICYDPYQDPVFPIWDSAARAFIQTGRKWKIEYVVKSLSNNSGTYGAFVVLIRHLTDDQVTKMLKYLKTTPIKEKFGDESSISYFGIDQTKREIERRQREHLINEILHAQIYEKGIVSIIDAYDS